MMKVVVKATFTCPPLWWAQFSGDGIQNLLFWALFYEDIVG